MGKCKAGAVTVWLVFIEGQHRALCRVCATEQRAREEAAWIANRHGDAVKVRVEEWEVKDATVPDSQ